MSFKLLISSLLALVCVTESNAIGFLSNPTKLASTVPVLAASNVSPIANLTTFWDYQQNTDAALPTISPGVTNITSWKDTNTSLTLSGSASNSAVGVGPWQGAGFVSTLALPADVVISSNNAGTLFAFVRPYPGGGTADQELFGKGNNVFGLFTNLVGLKVNGVLSTIPVTVTNTANAYFIAVTWTAGGALEWFVNQSLTNTTTALTTNVVLRFVGSETNTGGAQAAFCSIMNTGYATNRHFTTTELTNLMSYCITNGRTVLTNPIVMSVRFNEGTGTTATDTASNVVFSFSGTGVVWKTNGPNGNCLASTNKSGWLDGGTATTNTQSTIYHTTIWVRCNANNTGGKGFYAGKGIRDSNGQVLFEMSFEGSNPTWRFITQLSPGSLFYENQGSSAVSGKLFGGANGLLGVWHRVDTEWNDTTHAGLMWIDGVAEVLPPASNTVNASVFNNTAIVFFANGEHGELSNCDISNFIMYSGPITPQQIVKNHWLARTDNWAN